MSELNELLDLIKYYDDKYYKLGISEISDTEYDILKQKYITLGGDYNYIASDMHDDSQKYVHPYKILSLDKFSKHEEAVEEIRKLWPVVVQPKIDGMTIMLYPGNAVTRGNGTQGDILTESVLHIQNLGALAEEGKWNNIRIEVYMDKADLVEVNKLRENAGEDPFENTRNAVPGILRKGLPEYLRYLRYLAYNIAGVQVKETIQLERLKQDGFNVVPTGRFNSPEEAMGFILNYDKNKLPYDIDGMVVKSDIDYPHSVFGSTGHHPNYMFAFKWESPGAWTELLDVTFQVGRTGKIVPVAELKPVRIANTTVSRATLHNKKFMNALGLTHSQASVYVVKSGDIIPAITKVTDIGTGNRIIEPTHCPICSHELVTVNDQLFCHNAFCPSKTIKNIAHLAKQEALNIVGLSEETAKKMVESNMVLYPWDIFKLEIDDIQKLGGFAKKSSTVLYNRIQKAKAPELKNFLYAAGIPTVGRHVSELLADTFGSFSAIIKDIQSGCNTIKTIPTIGETIVNNITNNYKMWLYLFQYVMPKDAVTKKVETQNKNCWTFCITGTLAKPRSYYEDMIKQAGHKVTGAIGRNTDFLVTGKNVGMTKITASEKHGVERITENALINMLSGGN